MHKSTLIFSIGLFALLLSQGYWLYNTYRNYQDKNKSIIEDLLYDTVEHEATIRWLNPLKTKEGHKFTIKRADEMSPEERKKLKGDTLVLKATNKQRGKSISELFSATVQDNLLAKRPIRLYTLDSLFAKQLQSQGIPPAFQISLYDQQNKVVKQIDHAFEAQEPSLETTLQPIGSHHKLFIQATVNLPPSVILRHMLYALIISVLVVLVGFVCLYYQWKALGKARRQLQERERMVHGAIHDLKAPLNTVFTLLDYLQQSGIDSDLCIYLKNGKIQVRKLTDTIESMLHQLKAENKSGSLNKTTIDLPETVQNAFNGMQTLYPSKQAVFRIDNRMASPTVSTDAVRLERCLRNLLENALKYSDEKVEITVALSLQNNLVSVAVADNGWGIPAKQQKQLGKQFFRVERKNKPNRPGFGIGVCSTKHLAVELGGSLRFQSTEGKGSVFTLLFPIA